MQNHPMLRIRPLACIAAGIACALIALPFAQAADLTGKWSGMIEFGGQGLLIVLRVTTDEDGALSALMDSPDQGAYGIPVGSIAEAGGEISLDLPVLGASYRAVLDDARERMTGHWKQSGVELPLILERAVDEPDSNAGTPAGSRAATRRPQEPDPPFPYRSIDVTFTNEQDGITLAGTVTIPGSATAAGPVPGIVLLSGSGQRERDQPIFGHRPFMVLADAFTRAGFAVLRFDDRGAGESGGRETLASVTSEDLARDAAAALAFLTSHEGVSPDRVGFIGHSEGAMLAVMAATLRPQTDGDAHAIDRDPSDSPGPAGHKSPGNGTAFIATPAFLVLLGGHALPGHELMMLQSAALMRAAGLDEEAVQEAAGLNRRVYDLVLSLPDTDAEAARDGITGLLSDFGMPQAQIDAQIAGLLSPWYRFFLAYDPRPALGRVGVPVLALIGELDRQVPPDENLAALEQALAGAPTRDVTVREFPGVNHLLQTAETGGVDEYSRIEETFSPGVIRAIVAWLEARVR